MNARVKVVTGTFNILGQVDDDKIDQIARLLGLTEAEKDSLKGGNGLLVVGPVDSGSDSAA